MRTTLLPFFLLFSGVNANSLSGNQIDLVKQRLAQGSQQSWELGTRAQALLEYDSPSYSALTVDAAVPPSQDDAPNSLNSVLTIAKVVVGNLKEVTSQPEALIASDGSSADPASIGVAVVLANWTRQGSGDGLNYAVAASNQFQYLLNDVPKTDDGAISHRNEEVQLWSDFMYMVPPFLAYYGVVTENRTAISEAYNQCKLYRNYLRDDSAGGMWRHIAMGSSEDPGHWSTGNGWAAAGMLRVLGTMKNSQYADDFKHEQKDLANWVLEIQDGMYGNIRSNNLFGNYADEENSFDDAASTALMASTVYRLSLLADKHRHLPAAENSRNTLSSTNSSGGLAYFDSRGWLTPVVNPHNVGAEGSESPEAQAFVVMMQAAYNDWVEDGSKGANAASHLMFPSRGLIAVGFFLALLI